MCRLALLLFVLAACPKKKDAEPEPAAGSSAPPPRGYSVTKTGSNQGEGSGSGGSAGGRLSTAALNQAAGVGSDGSGAGSAAGGSGDAGSGSAAQVATAPVDAGVKSDAALFGGNGSPPYIDDEGHLHGPGGPIFMGKGQECNAERNHCIREGTWFSVGNLVAGKLYRAVPIFEFEGKWYNWRGKEEDFAMRFKTKVGTKDTLKVGDPVIWFIDENASKKFVDNEYDALTSSRWEAGVIEQVMADKIRVKGWTYGTVPIDTTRIILDKRLKGEK